MSQKQNGQSSSNVDSSTSYHVHNKTKSSFAHSQSLWFIVVAIFTLKSLFIPTYHSTDFDVHRNWMAITSNLSLEQWYYDSTSQWTFDYPPLFAYFEYALSKVAKLVVPEALVLQPEPFFSLKFLYFHRITVIITDIFYVYGCYFLVNGISQKILPLRNAEGLGLALISCIPLLIVDNIHFQYNSFLTAFLLISIACLFKRNFIAASFWYCVLLNLKHIYLYYAPAYVIIILTEYICVWKTKAFIRNGFKLAMMMSIPFIGSFGPLIYCGGNAIFWQIIRRLFPFQRGLTHAYWAPNIWACYNFVDFSLYNALRYMKRLPLSVLPPSYTSGLVQEYSHTILPNVTPKLTLLITVILILPMLSVFNKRFASKDVFLILLTHSSFAFFLAGYHVHEKAIIMILVPFTILAFCDPRYVALLKAFCLTSTVSLFPLLFTPFESLIKIVLALMWYFFMEVIFAQIPSMALKSKNYFSRICFIYLSIVQLYALVIHHMAFGSLYAFIPLMLTSTSTALCVIATFIQFLYITYIS